MLRQAFCSVWAAFVRVFSIEAGSNRFTCVRRSPNRGVHTALQYRAVTEEGREMDIRQRVWREREGEGCGEPKSFVQE